MANWFDQVSKTPFAVQQATPRAPSIPNFTPYAQPGKSWYQSVADQAYKASEGLEPAATAYSGPQQAGAGLMGRTVDWNDFLNHRGYFASDQGPSQYHYGATPDKTVNIQQRGDRYMVYAPRDKFAGTPYSWYSLDGKHLGDDYFTAADEPGKSYGPYAALMVAGGFGAALAGAGAAAGAAGSAAGGGGAGAGTTAGMAGVGSSVIPEGVAFVPATASEMGAMGLGGGTAAMGAGAGGIGSGITDLGGGLTMGADGSIMGGTGAFTPATAGEMGAMGVSAGSPTFWQQVGSGASKLFGNGGGSGGGGMGGFNWTDLIGPATSLAGGYMSADASKDASAAQLQAAREAMALNEPFRQGGIAGMNRLLDLLGLSQNTTAAGYGTLMKDPTLADFEADPGYQFRKQEQERALTRAASAAGGLGSGKYLKDAMDYSGGLASQEYGNWFNRFQALRQNKLNPLQSLMGAGQTAANTVGEYATQAGNAQAAGKVGAANAWNNALTQGVGMYNNQQQANQNNAFQNALLRKWGVA